MKVVFLTGARNHIPMFSVLAEFIQERVSNTSIEFHLFNGSEGSDQIQAKGHTVKRVGENIHEVYKSERWNFAEYARKYVNEINCNLLFVPFEYGFLHFVVHFAKRAGIKTFHVQHALWGRGKFYDEFYHNDTSKLERILVNRPYKLSEAISNKKAKLLQINKKYPIELKNALRAYYSMSRHEKRYPLSADYFLVPTHAYANQVKEERPGFPSRRVVVSGVLKEGLHTHLYARQQLANKFDLDDNKPWFSYLFAAFEVYPDRYSLNQSSKQALIEFLQVLQQVEPQGQTMILVHPTAKTDLADVLGKFPGTRIVEAVDEHFDIYRNSQLICGVKSTALLEACVALKPVFRQDYVLQGEYDSVQRESKAVICCDTFDILKSQIQTWQKDERRNARLEEQEKVINEYYPSLNKLNLEVLFR